MHTNNVWEGIKNKEKIRLYTSTNAYNQDFLILIFYKQTQSLILCWMMAHIHWKV